MKIWADFIYKSITHGSTSCNICCLTNFKQCCTGVLNGVDPVSIFGQHRSTTFNKLNGIFQHSTWHDTLFKFAEQPPQGYELVLKTYGIPGFKPFSRFTEAAIFKNITKRSICEVCLHVSHSSVQLIQKTVWSSVTTLQSPTVLSLFSNELRYEILMYYACFPRFL